MSDNIEFQLDADLLELESQLAALVPSAMRAETTLRMEDAMHNALEEKHDEELQDLEVHLGQLAPAGMSSDMVTRMAQAMDRWHEYVPLEEKLVPFGDRDDSATDQLNDLKESSKASGYGMFAAAAAVALLGATAALVIPHINQSSAGGSVAGVDTAIDSPSAPLDSRNLHSVDVSNAPRDAWVEPGSLSHRITSTADAGVMVTSDNVLHRNIRIDYVDRIKVIDEEGREIEINRPGVQYMLIPVKTN